MAISGLVVGQAQPPRELVLDAPERGLGACEGIALEQLEGHTAFLEHRDIALDRRHLRIGAEQLQRAATALFVAEAGIGTQFAQHVAAVLRQTHHALLVHRIAFGRAVLQHFGHPLELKEAAIGTDGERRMALEQPLDGLERNAWRGPGGGISGRDLAGVGIAGLERRTRLAVDHRDAGAGAGEEVSRGGADDPAAENDDVHEALLKTFQVRARHHA